MGYSFKRGGRGGGGARRRGRDDRRAVAGLERLEGRTLFAATPFDPTFGAGGRSYVDVAGMAEDASVIHVLPDGKILIAGDATFGVDLNAEGVNRAFVARLNADGSLDNTFGAGGIATYPDDVSVGLNNDTIPQNPYVHRTWSIAVGPDGRVFVGGQTTTYYPEPKAGQPFPWQYDHAFGVLAVRPDGVVDSSFGTKGIAVADMKHTADGGDTEWVFALTVQGDGKVVAAGMVGKDGDDQNDMGVVRFNTDGSVDPTFGKQVENFPRLDADRPRMEYATTVTIQGDGKVVVAGRTAAKDGVGSAVALVRYNPDGTKDTTFGQGGRVMTPLAPPDPDMPRAAWGVDKVHQVLVQPDGKLVVAAKVGIKLVGLLRYNPDGSPDASFGNNGVVIAQAVTVHDVHVEYQPSDGGLSLAVAGNGMEKIPVGSEPNSYTTRALGAQAYVARFDATGRRVSSARSDGAAMVGDEYLAALAVRPDGKLVAAGAAHVLPNSGEGGAWWQTGDALVVRVDPAGLTPDAPDPGDSGAPPAAGVLLKAWPVARGGRWMKFQLQFTSAQDVQHNVVFITGPNGIVEQAQLRGVKVKRAAASAVATYRAPAPHGRFGPPDNGLYAMRLGAADGTAVGQFTVAVPARPGSAMRRLRVAGAASLLSETKTT